MSIFDTWLSPPHCTIHCTIHSPMHYPHPTALSTPHCTIHTTMHYPHHTALSTPRCTIHTALHYPHPTALSTPHCTTPTTLHYPHRTALSTPHCTIHTPLPACSRMPLRVRNRHALHSSPPFVALYAHRLYSPRCGPIPLGAHCIYPIPVFITLMPPITSAA
jgi:hypothetical protein